MTLEEFLALNAQIAAFDRMPGQSGGLQRRMGLRPAKDLALIDTAMAERMALGGTLEDAIQEQKGDWPPGYFQVIEAGLRGGSIEAGWEAIADVRNDESRLLSGSGEALSYPLILGGLACCGVAYFVRHQLPLLRATYATNHATPGPEVKWLDASEEILPLIMAVGMGFSILALIGVAISKWRGTSPLLWVTSKLPGLRRAVRWARWARVARLAERYVQRGMAPREATRIAASLLVPATPAPLMSREFRPPSFFAWCLDRMSSTTASSTNGDPQSYLRLVADVYASQAERTAARFRRRWPRWISLLLGGAIVLVYALIVFLPFVRLLHQLSVSVPGAMG